MKSTQWSRVMRSTLERKCLEILGEAVSRTVGTGFVHAAIAKAAASLTLGDQELASKAFRLLSAKETRKVRSRALEDAELLQEHGEIADPLLETMGNPAYAHVRHAAHKLGGS
jgi:hypothetical protein